MSNPAEKLKNLVTELKSDHTILHFGAVKLTGMLSLSAGLHTVQKSGLQFNSVYGSQIGALFATMYAAEIKTAVLTQYLVHDLRHSDVFDFNFKKLSANLLKLRPLDIEGICRGRKAFQRASELLKYRKENHPQNLYIFAEYFRYNKLKLFKVPEAISFIEALKASNALSGLYSPYYYNNEIFVDAGLFGSLPLVEIYRNEQLLTGKKRPRLTVVAFQDGFSSNYSKLTLAERVLYSFHEKLRYHSMKIELSRIEKYHINLVLVSFRARTFNDKSIFRMSEKEKKKALFKSEAELNEQFDYYTGNIKRGRLKCEPFSVI